MNTAFGYSLDELSPDVRFFEKIRRVDFVDTTSLDQLFEEAHKLKNTFFLAKNENHTYIHANILFAQLQHLEKPEDITNRTDFDIPTLEIHKQPKALQLEDTACMKGRLSSTPYGGIVMSKSNTPMLIELKKIPIIKNNRSLGIICTAINITNAFLNLKEKFLKNDIKNSRILPNKITPRQLEALKIYNQGLPRKTAAKQLNISETTYAWYLREIRSKFSIKTRAEMLILEQNFTCEKMIRYDG